MRRLFWLIATFALLVVNLCAQTSRPARIHIGDEVTVYVYKAADMSGVFTVQSDGAIYVPRIGRLVVQDLTTESAQAKLIVRLKSIYTDPTATISIKLQRSASIFVVGSKEGFVPYNSETDLRQVYAASKLEGDPDLLQVSVFRNGTRIATMSATDLTSGKPGVFNGPLQSNDLVVFEPKPFIRDWVIGTVQKPGRLRLNVGDDVYKAIAEAGDIAPTPAGAPTQLRSDYTVVVRRGPESIPLPLVISASQKPVLLEEGDTISVEPPSQIRVTFTGYAKNPGERFFRAGTGLATAVGAAGGAAPATTVTASGNTNEPEGSLKDVILFHNGSATFHDLSPNPEGPIMAQGPVLGDGDVIYIPRNERAIYVFGSVARVGRVTMQDNRNYRLADAVAEAGGASTNGTLTRVSLGRPGPDGKIVVKTYRLDRYVKVGDEKENPVLQKNDVVYVDSSRGITFQNVVAGISAALLVNSLAGR